MDLRSLSFNTQLIAKPQTKIDPMHKWLQFKILLYAFKLAQLTSFGIVNSKTSLVGLILIFTKEFLIGSHLCIGSIVGRLLLEWILQNMVRHFVTHKQVQADKRHPI